MLTRFLSLAASSAVLAFLVYLGVSGLATSEATTLAVTRALLQAQAALPESAVRKATSDLERLASGLANDAQLGNDFRGLAALVAVYTPGNKLARSLQLKIDSLRGRLGQRLTAWRRANPHAESVVLLSPTGLVLCADSARFAVGSNVTDNRDNAKGTANGTPDFLLKALSGVPQAGVSLSKAGLALVSLEPVFVKANKLAGVVMVEQPLRKLPGIAVGGGFLVMDGVAILGNLPRGAQLDPAATDAYVLVPGEVHTTVLGVPIGLKPLGVELSHAGLWARNFMIPGTDRASGAVAHDLTEYYSALGTHQWTLIFVAVLMWPCLLLLGALPGRRLRRDLARVADFLSKLQQGGTERRLAEGKLMPELHRLARLLNALVGNGATVKINGGLDGASDGPFGADSGDSGDSGDSARDALESSATVDAVAQLMSQGKAAQGSAPADGMGALFENLGGGAGFGQAAAAALATSLEADPPLPPAQDGGWTDILETSAAGRDALLARLSEPAVEVTQTRGTLPPGLDAEPTVQADAPPPELPPERGAGPMLSARDQFLARLSSKAASASAESAPVAARPATLPPGLPDLPGLATPDEPGGFAVAATTEMALPTDGGHSRAEDDNYHQVYTEFMELRRSCGEGGELPYQKFAARLDDTRAQVVARHACNEVFFQAYVKNGKAALKAVPK